jgi:hypothetical protein
LSSSVSSPDCSCPSQPFPNSPSLLNGHRRLFVGKPVNALRGVPMSKPTTHYAALGVTVDASPEDIRRAYLKRTCARCGGWRRRACRGSRRRRTLACVVWVRSCEGAAPGCARSGDVVRFRAH